MMGSRVLMGMDWRLREVPACVPLPGGIRLFQPRLTFFRTAPISFVMAKLSDETKRADFPPTRWTLISRVRRGSEEEAGRAMEDLCRAYWYPIYAFARRGGCSPHDAEDLTQIFFQNLVTSEGVQEARREKGRLRTFLLAMLKRVISKQLRFESAEKRGGKYPDIVSFDEKTAEERYALEPLDIHDPDALFDRAWAEEVLQAASEKLRADYVKADNLEIYEHLSEFLPLGDNDTPYPEAAKKLAMREATLRLQIHRMRKRYAKLIEEIIAQTVGDATEQKAELQHLMAVMGR